MVPGNLTLVGFAYIWQSKWVGLITIKTKRAQIDFLSDVLVAVASLDLKVPCIIGCENWNVCQEHYQYVCPRDESHIISCVSHSPLTMCLSQQLYIDATEVLKGQEKLDTKSFLPRLVVVFLFHLLCENSGTFYCRNNILFMVFLYSV